MQYVNLFFLFVFRVNFMKNEKAYDSTKSEVLKMLQELENEPQDSDPEADLADHVPFRKPVSIPKDEPVVPFVPVAPAARVAPVAPVAPVAASSPASAPNR